MFARAMGGLSFQQAPDSAVTPPAVSVHAGSFLAAQLALQLPLHTPADPNAQPTWAFSFAAEPFWRSLPRRQRQLFAGYASLTGVNVKGQIVLLRNYAIGATWRAVREFKLPERARWSLDVGVVR